MRFSRIERRARAPVPRLHGLAGQGAQAFRGERKFDALHGQQLLVLADHGVARFGQDAHQVVLGERAQGGDDGQAADELGDHAELEQVLGLDLLQHVADVVAGEALQRSAPKPSTLRPRRWRMMSSTPTKAPPQMKRMFSVLIWMYSCCGCLRPALRRNVADGAFDDLEQGLLHAFAATRRG